MANEDEIRIPVRLDVNSDTISDAIAEGAKKADEIGKSLANAGKQGGAAIRESMKEAFDSVDASKATKGIVKEASAMGKAVSKQVSGITQVPVTLEKVRTGSPLKDIVGVEDENAIMNAIGRIGNAMSGLQELMSLKRNSKNVGIKFDEAAKVVDSLDKALATAQSHGAKFGEIFNTPEVKTGMTNLEKMSAMVESLGRKFAKPFTINPFGQQVESPYGKAAMDAKFSYNDAKSRLGAMHEIGKQEVLYNSSPFERKIANTKETPIDESVIEEYLNFIRSKYPATTGDKDFLNRIARQNATINSSQRKIVGYDNHAWLAFNKDGNDKEYSGVTQDVFEFAKQRFSIGQEDVADVGKASKVYESIANFADRLVAALPVDKISAMEKNGEGQLLPRREVEKYTGITLGGDWVQGYGSRDDNKNFVPSKSGDLPIQAMYYEVIDDIIERVKNGTTGLKIPSYEEFFNTPIPMARGRRKSSQEEWEDGGTTNSYSLDPKIAESFARGYLSVGMFLPSETKGGYITSSGDAATRYLNHFNLKQGQDLDYSYEKEIFVSQDAERKNLEQGLSQEFDLTQLGSYIRENGNPDGRNLVEEYREIINEFFNEIVVAANTMTKEKLIEYFKQKGQEAQTQITNLVPEEFRKTPEEAQQAKRAGAIREVATDLSQQKKLNYLNNLKYFPEEAQVEKYKKIQHRLYSDSSLEKKSFGSVLQTEKIDAQSKLGWFRDAFKGELNDEDMLDIGKILFKNASPSESIANVKDLLAQVYGEETQGQIGEKIKAVGESQQMWVDKFGKTAIDLDQYKALEAELDVLIPKMEKLTGVTQSRPQINIPEGATVNSSAPVTSVTDAKSSIKKISQGLLKKGLISEEDIPQFTKKSSAEDVEAVRQALVQKLQQQYTETNGIIEDIIPKIRERAGKGRHAKDFMSMDEILSFQPKYDADYDEGGRFFNNKNLLNHPAFKWGKKYSDVGHAPESKFSTRESAADLVTYLKTQPNLEKIKTAMDSLNEINLGIGSQTPTTTSPTVAKDVAVEVQDIKTENELLKGAIEEHKEIVLEFEQDKQQTSEPIVENAVAPETVAQLEEVKQEIEEVKVAEEELKVEEETPVAIPKVIDTSAQNAIIQKYSDAWKAQEIAQEQQASGQPIAQEIWNELKENSAIGSKLPAEIPTENLEAFWKNLYTQAQKAFIKAGKQIQSPDFFNVNPDEIEKKGKFTIISGIPGAGKSSFTDTLPEGTVKVDQDTLKKDVFGSETGGPEFSFDLLKTLNALKKFKIQEALANGNDVVLDGMNATKKARKQAIEWGGGLASEVDSAVIPTPATIAAARQNFRPRKIDPQAIYNAWQNWDTPTLDEGFSKITEYRNHDALSFPDTSAMNPAQLDTYNASLMNTLKIMQSLKPLFDSYALGGERQLGIPQEEVKGKANAVETGGAELAAWQAINEDQNGRIALSQIMGSMPDSRQGESQDFASFFNQLAQIIVNALKSGIADNYAAQRDSLQSNWDTLSKTSSLSDYIKATPSLAERYTGAGDAETEKLAIEGIKNQFGVDDIDIDVSDWQTTIENIKGAYQAKFTELTQSLLSSQSMAQNAPTTVPVTEVVGNGSEMAQIQKQAEQYKSIMESLHNVVWGNTGESDTDIVPIYQDIQKELAGFNSIDFSSAEEATAKLEEIKEKMRTVLSEVVSDIPAQQANAQKSAAASSAMMERVKTDVGGLISNSTSLDEYKANAAQFDNAHSKITAEDILPAKTDDMDWDALQEKLTSRFNFTISRWLESVKSSITADKGWEEIKQVLNSKFVETLNVDDATVKQFSDFGMRMNGKEPYREVIGQQVPTEQIVDPKALSQLEQVKQLLEEIKAAKAQMSATAAPQEQNADLTASIQSKSQQALGLMQQNGKYMGEGVVEGLTEADVASGSDEIVAKIINGIKSAAGISSPAEEFKPIGYYMAMGIVEGFKELNLGELVGTLIMDAIQQAFNSSKDTYDPTKFNELLNQVYTGAEYKDQALAQKASNLGGGVKPPVTQQPQPEQPIENAMVPVETQETETDEQQVQTAQMNINGGTVNISGLTANTITVNGNVTANANGQQQGGNAPTGQPQAQATVNTKATGTSGMGAMAGRGGMGDMYSMGNQMKMSLQGILSQWLGINAAVNMVRKSISSMSKTITELDKSITAIATVTNLSSSDLWGQMAQYTAQAKEFGVSINSVYQASLLYYQQGMATNQVTEMTNQTLKMAKISGLDTGKAADYMTNAFRAFKMEMSDVGQIADSYAALAANAATSTSEIAEAMTKAATGAEMVGISFKNTSAFITMMIETTRESASTIGSALSSITARYSKIQSDPSGVKEEGDNMTTTLNDVDKALQSIGIDMQDSNGQIRDMDEVIVELSEIWGTLDRNTQSYVATLMAGARMKSKFLALVGDADRLSELMEISANSEDTAQVQLLKNMDSIETKTQQLQTAMQGLYTNLGIEKIKKGFLDIETTIVNSFNNLSSGAMLSKLTSILAVIATLGTQLIAKLRNAGLEAGRQFGQGVSEGMKETNAQNNTDAQNKGKEMSNALNSGKSSSGGLFSKGGKGGMILALAGTALSGISAVVPTSGVNNTTGRIVSSATGLLGGVASGAGTGAMIGGVPGAIVGGVIGGLTNLSSALETFNYTNQEKLADRAQDKEDANNDYILAKNEANTLDTTIKKLERLKAARYESNEANQEYIDYMNEVASSYPELVSAYDSENNAIISLSYAYDELSTAAAEAAKKQKESASAGYQYTEQQQSNWQEGMDWIDSNPGRTSAQITSDAESEKTDSSLYSLSVNENDFGTLFNEYMDAMSSGSTTFANGAKLADWNWTGDTVIASDDIYGGGYQWASDLAQKFKDVQGEDSSTAKAILDAIDSEQGLTLDALMMYVKQYESLNDGIVQSVENSKLDVAASSIKDVTVTNMGSDSTSALYETYSDIYGNNNIQALMSQALLSEYESSAEAIDGMDIDTWANSANGIESANEIVTAIFESYNGLNQKCKDAFIDLLGDFGGFANETDIKSYLSSIGIDNEEIQNQVIDYYKSTTQADSELFGNGLRQFATDNLGKIKISDVGFYKNATNNSIGNIESNNIAGDYYDAILADLTEVDDLVEAGLTQRAQSLYDATISAWNVVGDSSIGDQDQRNAVANWINSSDLTTFEGIYSAEQSLNELHEAGTITNEQFNALTDSIVQFKKAVDVNATTYVNSLAESFASAKDTLDDMTGELDFDKAIEQFKEMSNAKDWNDTLNFTDIYEMNSDGKWQLTAQGAILARNQALEKLDQVNADTKTQLDSDLASTENLKYILESGYTNESWITNNAWDGESLDWSGDLGSVIFDENDRKIFEEAWNLAQTKKISLQEALQQIQEETQDAVDQAPEIYQAGEDAINKVAKVNAFKEIDFDKISGLDTTADDLADQQSLIQTFLESSTPDKYADEENGATQLEADTEAMMQAIANGDLAAIKSINKEFADSMTTAQKQTVYDTKFTNASDLFEILQKGYGQILDDSMVSVLDEIGLSDAYALNVSTGEFITTGDLTDAQYDLLREYVAGASNNIESVNEEIATILEEQTSNQSSVQSFIKAAAGGDFKISDIEDMANAMGITINQFLTDYNDYITNNGDGTYNVNFDSWDEFVAALNNGGQNLIDTNADWYKDAAISYLNSLSTEASNTIDRATKIDTQIVSQFKNLTSAGAGDMVDVSYLSTLFDSEAEMSAYFESMGIAYADGVATLEGNFNLNDAINLANYISENGAENIDDQLSELQDAIQSAIKNWVSLLSKGVGGTLTNVEADQLKTNFSLTDDAFTQTADGLKLSEAAVAEIYSQMKATDSVAAQMSLKKIIDDADSLGDGINSDSELLDRIEGIQTILYSKNQEIVDSERERLGLISATTEELEDELALLQDIQLANLDSADAFKLSDEKVPDSTQAALNAWGSAADWMKSIQTMQSSGDTKGMMGYEDFKNMIDFISENTVQDAKNFMNSGMTAAELIEAGGAALKNVDGSTYVDLSEIGTGFLASSNSLKDNVTAGMNSLAQSQVDMLDGIIGVLETVVAMQDIDVGGDNKLDFSDLFDFITVGNEGQYSLTKSGEKLLAMAEESEDLKLGLQKIEIAGESLYDYLTDPTKLNGISEETKVAFSNVLDAFYQSFDDIDWGDEGSVQDAYNKIAQILSGEGLSDVTVTIGNITLTPNGSVTVNWDELTDETKAALAKYNINSADDVGTFLNKYLTETTHSDEEIETYLLLTGKVKVGEDNTYIDENGESHDTLAQAMIANSMIKAAGDKSVGETTSENGYTITEHTTELDLPYNVIVNEKTGETSYQVHGFGNDANTYFGSTLEEAQENAVNGYLKKYGNNNEFDGLTADEKKIAVKRKYNIEETPDISLSLGTDTNSGSNKSAAAQIMAMSDQQIQDAINSSDGKTLTISGLTFDIGEDADVNADSVRQAVANAFGIDTDLISSISTAITTAFSGDAGAQIGTVLSGAITSALTGANGTPIDLSQIQILVPENGITITNTELQTQMQSAIQAAINGMTLDEFTREISLQLILNKAGLKVANGTEGRTTPNGNPIGGEQTGLNISTIEVEGAQIEATGSTVNFDEIELKPSNLSISTNNVTLSKGGQNNNDDKSNTKKQSSESQMTSTESVSIDYSGLTSGLAEEAMTAGVTAGSNIKTGLDTGIDSAVTSIESKLNDITVPKITATVTNPNPKITAKISGSLDFSATVPANAKGTVNLSLGNQSGSYSLYSGRTRTIPTMNATAEAKGNFGSAMASGSTSTLMGELGPELVVSNGRYYTVGNNGAEFVDLPNDAIVFNHLQTQQLMTNGKTSNGKPYKNEREAVAFATGNANGPALSNASSALAALKQLRAMWQSLASASASDLGKMAGGGGGGGGGSDNKAYQADLERWYNLEQQIARIEEELTLLEKERAAYISAAADGGYKYVASLKQSLNYTNSEIAKQQELLELVEDYYQKRVDTIKNGIYGSLVEVNDETGAIQYSDKGFKLLADLQETNSNGVTLKNKASDQIGIIAESLGITKSEVKSRYGVNASGEKADSDEQIVQNFWDAVDGIKEEYESYQGKIDDAKEQLADLEKTAQEIKDELRDNEISVEKNILTAITDSKQAQIDAQQDTLDAIKEASSNYINGLKETMDKEKSMYEAQQSNSDLVKMQRQLAILQRTGGSASEINSLQSQINDSLQDNYFEEQQKQIDAIQSAVDKQTSDIEQQINIQKEALEYSKENGLYLEEVRTMMKTWSYSNLIDFIKRNTASYQGMSATELEKQIDETDAENLQKFFSDYFYDTIYDMIEDAFGSSFDNLTSDQQNDIITNMLKTYSNTDRTNGTENAESAAKNSGTIESNYDTYKNNLSKAKSAGAEVSTIMTQEEFEKLSTDNQNGAVNNSEIIKAKAMIAKGYKLEKGTKQYKNSTGTSKTRVAKGGTYSITGAKNGRLKLEKNGKTYWIENEEYLKYWNDLYEPQAFATGGSVDFTGPAWLDGTKTKPEAVLSASDYELLKSKLFSDSNYSLKSALEEMTSFTEAMANVSNNINNTDSGITFENVNLTIESGTIANDYDAERAGQNIMDEMMKIARKSGTISITRR